MADRVKLIFNPIANLGRAWAVAASLRPIVYELGGADWTGTVYPTHATELARKAAEEGYDRIVAMGGDGTMHEVLNGLMQIPEARRPGLGVVPVGSGNDFAYAAGISPLPEQALRQALSGTAKPIDVGSVTDNRGRKEYWANAIGIGFDTIVTIRSRKITAFQGFAIYFIAVLQTILFQYESFSLDIRLDGRDWQHQSLLLALCNGSREGGGFHVAPEARVDDGLFNYLGIDRIGRLSMLRTLPEVMKGTHAKLKHVHTGVFKQMEIHSNQPLFIHTDGEIFATPSSPITDLHIEMLQGAVKLFC